MLPNFLCIGSQKAGTSWLYSMLMQHENIWLPPIKEVHYYDYYFGENTGTDKWGPPHIKKAMARIKAKDYKRSEDFVYANALDLHEILTPNWYEAIFNHSDAYRADMVGEITPEYCSINNSGIEKIKSDLVKPKIIWIIRDPVERAVSQIKMVSNRSSMKPDSDNWRSVLKKVRYKNRANYKKYIPLWDSFFSDDILYIPYGNISSDPFSVLKSLESFLGVKHHKYVGVDEVVHKTKKLNVPKAMIAQLESEFESQYVFLEERFGANFLSQIK